MSSPSRGFSRALGALAVSWYLASGAEGALEGHWEDFLWTCIVGLLAVGVGLLLRCPGLAAVGALLVLFGDALWLLSLLGPETLTWFNTVTHGGGLLVSLFAVRTLGFPRGTWWKAALTLLALRQLCRWVTPPDANVNLAFRVYEGYEEAFPSFVGYIAFLTTLGCAAFFGAEWILRRTLAPPPPPDEEPHGPTKDPAEGG